MSKEEYYIPRDEDFEDEPPRPPGPLSKLPKAKHFRPAIICFVLFYVASTLFGKYQVGQYLWASKNAVFVDHEYWRLLTSLFTHSGMLHLLSNALIFIVFGGLLRAYFGLVVFPVTTFIIGVLCTLSTIYFYEPHIKLVGASGMNYGMAALWLIFYLRYDTDRLLAIRIFRVVGFTLVMLVPSTYNPTTSYLAHGMGFVIGIIAGIILLPAVRVRDPRLEDKKAKHLRLMSEGEYYSDHGPSDQGPFRGNIH